MQQQFHTALMTEFLPWSDANVFSLKVFLPFRLYISFKKRYALE